MTSRFATAVDPIFLYVVDLLDRINAGEDVPPQEARRRIVNLFDEAEALLGAGQEWELAKYALVSWIDEMLVDAQWPGRDWWSNNVLEVELFNSRLCNELFYEKAATASMLLGRDALEVYYDCVILGFRGFYRDPNSAVMTAESHNLPRTLDEWTERTALGVRLGREHPPQPTPGRALHGAPPLMRRTTVVWTWLSVAMLAAANVLLYLLLEY